MNKKKLLKSVLIITFILLLSSSNIAFAGGLVPCGNPGLPACDLCFSLVLAKNIITFMIQLGIALAGLFFAWGAFVIMTAGGSEERISSGKQTITTVVIGLVLMFSAYLIVGTLLHVLTGSPNKIPWTQIQCTI